MDFLMKPLVPREISLTSPVVYHRPGEPRPVLQTNAVRYRPGLGPERPEVASYYGETASLH